MAELSGFWTTTGTATGDQQASYTQAHWSSALKITAACNGFEGVATDYLNELACTVTGANTVAVNTGGAMVDGKWYYNDASQNVNIPSASGEGNTRIDRVVLRADWANFNVSVYRIAGTDAAEPSAPAITETSGTTYDIMLYQALVDTDGVVDLTDERVYADLEDASITGAKIADDSIDSNHYVDGSIDTAHIGDAQVTLAKMAANSIDSDQYVDGSIDTAHLANDAVDDTKVGNRVPQFPRRQGGSDTDWTTVGTADKTLTNVVMQAGVVASSTSAVTVTFPIAFAQKPLVFAGGSNYDEFPVVGGETATTFTAAMYKISTAGLVSGKAIRWLAIGEV